LKIACISREGFVILVKKGISISKYMNNYTKLLADLANMDEVIKDEDKD